MIEARLRSGLCVAVPQIARTVDGWRERTCSTKPSSGAPPHITILFPFVPAEMIDDLLIADLARLFGAFAPFSFELGRTARFPSVLYLEPDPLEPFVRLTAAVHAAYPDFPPYEGAFAAVAPHLTVAEGDEDVLAAAEADVAPALPLPAKAHEVLLLEELEPNSACWRQRAMLPLSASGRGEP
jgi:2'-5' RNA ligase